MSCINIGDSPLKQRCSYVYYFLFCNRQRIYPVNSFQMETSHNSINLFVRKCVMYFIYNIDNSSVRTTIEYNQPFLRFYYNTLFMRKIINHIPLSLFAIHMCTFSIFLQSFCTMRYNPNSIIYLTFFCHIYKTVRISL